MTQAQTTAEAGSTTCKNCSGKLLPRVRFCSSCGQTAAIHRLSLHEIGHDFMHALIHVDRSAVWLLWQLIVRPGVVAGEFVSGKRKRYFGPFAFLAIVVALTAAIVGITEMQMVLPTKAIPDADFLSRFFGRHINLLLFLEVPLLAAVCRIVGLRDHFNYAEYLVLAAYTSAVHILFFLLLMVPASYAFSHTSAYESLYIAYLPLWPAYFGFAMTQFLGPPRWLSAVKGAAAALLTQIIVMASATVTASMIVASRSLAR